MEYNTGHTAKFLVSFFLNRKDSLKYKLNGSCRGILRYLADAIDMEFYKTGKRSVVIGIKQIAIYSGFSEKTVRSAIHYLIKKRILQKHDYLGGWSGYWLGLVPTLYALRKGEISTGAVKTFIECGNDYRTSNALSSKLQTCNKEILKIEKIKSVKSVLQSDPEKNKQAIRELAAKLGRESNH